MKAAIPTALVIALLAGVAVWGRSTDWKLPKFSELTGSAVEEKPDWCEEHNVPETQCIECNKDLIRPVVDYGWCEEHGVTQCPLHHPEVTQVSDTLKVSEKDMVRASRAFGSTSAQRKTTSNAKCIRSEFNSLLPKRSKKRALTLPSLKQDQSSRRSPRMARCNTTKHELRHLASRVPGTVWRVEKRVGEPVREGELLALIESAEVGRLKSDLLQAVSQNQVSQANVDRLQTLARDGTWRENHCVRPKRASMKRKSKSCLRSRDL